MKFKRKLYLTLTGLLLVLVLFTGIESFLEVKYNYIIPSYIPTIGLPIIFVAIILGVFKDTYDELVLFGIKLRNTQVAADEILVKYSEFQKSVGIFLKFNLAVLEKDGSFDNVTSSDSISQFLYSAKEVSKELDIDDLDIKRLRSIGKQKLFYAYEYELESYYHFPVRNYFELGSPEYVGGRYDLNLLSINFPEIKKLIDASNDYSRKDKLNHIFKRMKKDFEEL